MTPLPAVASRAPTALPRACLTGSRLGHPRFRHRHRADRPLRNLTREPSRGPSSGSTGRSQACPIGWKAYGSSPLVKFLHSQRPSPLARHRRMQVGRDCAQAKPDCLGMRLGRLGERSRVGRRGTWRRGRRPGLQASLRLVSCGSVACPVSYSHPASWARSAATWRVRWMSRRSPWCQIAS